MLENYNLSSKSKLYIHPKAHNPRVKETVNVLICRSDRGVDDHYRVRVGNVKDIQVGLHHQPLAREEKLPAEPEIQVIDARVRVSLARRYVDNRYARLAEGPAERAICRRGRIRGSKGLIRG